MGDLLSRLTLAEKISLVHADSKFTAAAIPRLAIPRRWLDDGPHGVREDIGPDTWEPAGRMDDFATAMPVGICLAATWNPDLGHSEGEAIGQEARARGKDIMLGPGVGTRTERRIQGPSASMQIQNRRRGLDSVEYVMVLTTFPAGEFPVVVILQWYRFRWQFELVFKRFKQIAQLGHLPKQDQEFLKFLDDEFADQELDLHLVINSYGTHKHPKVKAWLQRHPRFVLHVPVASIRWNGGLES